MYGSEAGKPQKRGGLQLLVLHTRVGVMKRTFIPEFLPQNPSVILEKGS